MDQISNPSIGTLMETLLQQMQESGYAESSLETTMRLARHISSFMEKHSILEYDESVGIRFIKDECQHRVDTMYYVVKLFISRLDSVLRGGELIINRDISVPVVLPAELNHLLEFYKEHCAKEGCAAVTISNYESRCRRFLQYLSEDGVNGNKDITTASISKACLRISGKTDFPIVQRFLRALFYSGYLDQDYSCIIPKWTKPQPMPSVYTMEEVNRIEASPDRSTPYGKRNYAMLLLSTRLAIRAGDIVRMSFDELDFQSEAIRLTQHKTGAMLELPMLPAIREALQDYIQNARGNCASPYVFLSFRPPYSHISGAAFGQIVRRAIRDAKIEPGIRRSGSHAMRSTLASSMVNDNVSYEVVRRTLGHRSTNAIRSYVKLDVEQLRLYSLDPPVATGNFADSLAGRCPAK